MLPLRTTQFPFQVVDLLLQGFVIVLLLGYVTSHLRMAFACMGSTYTLDVCPDLFPVQG